MGVMDFEDHTRDPQDPHVFTTLMSRNLNQLMPICFVVLVDVNYYWNIDDHEIFLSYQKSGFRIRYVILEFFSPLLVRAGLICAEGKHNVSYGMNPSNWIMLGLGCLQGNEGGVWGRNMYNRVCYLIS
jgi:hypothetical protein